MNKLAKALGVVVCQCNQELVKYREHDRCISCGRQPGVGWHFNSDNYPHHLVNYCIYCINRPENFVLHKVEA